MLELADNSLSYNFMFICNNIGVSCIWAFLLRDFCLYLFSFGDYFCLCCVQMQPLIMLLQGYCLVLQYWPHLLHHTFFMLGYACLVTHLVLSMFGPCTVVGLVGVHLYLSGRDMFCSLWHNCLIMFSFTSLILNSRLICLVYLLIRLFQGALFPSSASTLPVRALGFILQ